jgi:hypothetical protein
MKNIKKIDKKLLKKTWLARPFSWSQLSAFQYNRKQWFERYILNEKSPDTEALRFGKQIGERLASDPKFLPEVPRLKVFEQGISTTLGGIKLISYFDSFEPEPLEFVEYKTSANEAKWTHQSANEHGQMTFYYLQLYLEYKAKPEDIPSRLVYIPCEADHDFKLVISPEPIQIFEVKKTMADILRFAGEIKATRYEMEQIVEKWLAE